MNKPSVAWKNFWFPEAPYFDLAFVRILAVAMQCFLLLSIKFDYLHYTFRLPVELFRPLPALQIFMLPWGWDAPPDQSVVLTVFWLTFAFGLLALIGFLTNISLFLLALGSLFLQAFLYSFGDSHHPDAVMAIALLAFSLAPSGRVLSVDSWLRERRSDGAATVSLLDYSGRYAHWPLKLVQCFFALMYLSAVSSKLVVGGADWANGYTLQFYLIQDYFRRGSELGLLLSEHHYVAMTLQIAALIFQATFFLVVFFPRLRWIFVPIGLSFHLGIYFALGAAFPQWIVLYSVFIPWAEIVRRLAVKQVPEVAPVVGSAWTDVERGESGSRGSTTAVT